MFLIHLCLHFFCLINFTVFYHGDLWLLEKDYANRALLNTIQHPQWEENPSGSDDNASSRQSFCLLQPLNVPCNYSNPTMSHSCSDFFDRLCGYSNPSEGLCMCHNPHNQPCSHSNPCDKPHTLSREPTSSSISCPYKKDKKTSTDVRTFSKEKRLYVQRRRWKQSRAITRVGGGGDS